ncbi:hypothetical protein ACN20G_13330 [Streptomyces sp. BI20]|uniref:hypothetical protein n=1 Tax=Streptomyces sp. BI20 TaxID=3403460 RepID=UPI003C78CC7F
MSERPETPAPGPEKTGTGSAPSEAPELRALLHGAVAELGPSPDALDRIRRGVPRRQARRRRVVVAGAVFAALALGVPTALKVTAAGSEPGEAPHASLAHGGTADGGTADPVLPNAARPGGGHAGTQGGPDAGTAGPEGAGHADAGTDARPSRGSSASPTTGGGSLPEGPGRPRPPVVPTPLPPGSAPHTPRCTAAQLDSVAATGRPDAEGRVRGTFRVTNHSAADCLVPGPGAVVAQVRDGVSVRGGVRVLDNPGSGAATGLPDPSLTSSALILPPKTAYEVRFVWMPGGPACEAGSGEGADAAPSKGPGERLPLAEAGRAAAPGPEGGEASETADPGSDGTARPPAAGTLDVTHTPVAGAPGETVSIPATCEAGTVYRTDVLPVGAGGVPAS